MLRKTKSPTVPAKDLTNSLTIFQKRMQIHKIDEWPNLVLWRSPSTSLSSHPPRLLLDLGSVPTQVTQVPSFILATLHCHFLLKFDICHAFVTLILGHRGSFYWAPKWPNTWDLAFIFRLSTVSRPQIHNPAALSSIFQRPKNTRTQGPPCFRLDAKERHCVEDFSENKLAYYSTWIW